MTEEGHQEKLRARWVSDTKILEDGDELLVGRYRFLQHVKIAHYDRKMVVLMDFNVSERIKTIIGMVTEFVEKELIPLEPEFVNRPIGDLLPVLEAKRNMVKQMELWAPNHPKEYEGKRIRC